MPKTLATPALPPLLAPYIISSLKGPGTRHNSLTLVTYTLTASPFWLLLQYLSVGLLGAGADQETTSQRHADGFGGGVVLASFVREWEAWREGARRAGIDLSSSLTKTLGHVDLLSNPLLDAPKPLQALEKLILSTIERIDQCEGKHANFGGHGTSAQQGRLKPMLILDGLDLWLASMAGIDGIGVYGVLDLALELQEHTSAVVISLSADSPLLFPLSSVLAILENSHLALVTGLAHQADYVIQVRGLETGVARDVSGVIRVSRRSGWRAAGNHNLPKMPEEEAERADWEGLYFLRSDGGVKIWERGKVVESRAILQLR